MSPAPLPPPVLGTTLALLLLAGVGVAGALYLDDGGDGVRLQPIASASQVRRICVALCTSGLGGRSCGADCLDITPSELPVTLNASRLGAATPPPTARAAAPSTRRNGCPILCANRLGYPLCQCKGKGPAPGDDSEPDFVQVCGYYCVQLGYHLSGCQPCEVYRRFALEHGDDAFSPDADRNLGRSVDWDEWCRVMCSVGEGGAACNCDILPMMAPSN